MQAATVVINRRALRHNLQRLPLCDTTCNVFVNWRLPVKWLRW